MVLGSDHSRGSLAGTQHTPSNKMNFVKLQYKKVAALHSATVAWKETRDEQKYYASLNYPIASLEELKSQQHIVKNLMQRAEIYQTIADQIDLEAE